MQIFLRALKLLGAFFLLFFGCWLAFLIHLNPAVKDTVPLIAVAVLAIGATILWMDCKRN